MILVRLIILIAVVACLFWLIRRLFVKPSPPPDSEAEQSENMIQCKYCGTHAPESSITRVNEQPYCCKEHADLDQA